MFTASTAGAISGSFIITSDDGTITTAVSESRAGADAIPAETASIRLLSPQGDAVSRDYAGPTSIANIVADFVNNATFTGWTLSSNAAAIRASFNTIGTDVDGTFRAFVTGTNSDQVTATPAVITNGASATVSGGDYLFSSGRLIDGDYSPADRPDNTYVFEAQRYVYYSADEPEPEVSTNGALYDFRQTVQQGTVGADGRNGDITQTRFSTAETQPAASTYPTSTNNDGLNVTWGASSANAIWAITRQVTFDSENNRTNGSWSIQRHRGVDGEQGPTGQFANFMQTRFSDDLVQPSTSTYPENDLGTNATWTIASTQGRWALTREITYDTANLRTNGAWSISQWRGDDGQQANGDFTQTRFSTADTQPGESTYPDNDTGANSTWQISSASAVWAITREVTFDDDNVRSNGAWSVSRWLGVEGDDGINGEFTQVRYSAAASLPAASTYPNNNEGTNSTWGISSTNAMWFITRTVTFTSGNARSQTAWTCLLYTSPSPRDS